MNEKWTEVPLGALLARSDETIAPEPDTQYPEITVRLWGKGVVLRGMVSGAEVAAQRRFVARQGQFILSRIDARNGALGIVPPSLDGAIVSNDFPVFRIENRLAPAFLAWLCKTAPFVENCRRASEGTTNRVRLQEERFLATKINLPPYAEQQRIVAEIDNIDLLLQEANRLRQEASDETELLWHTSLREIIDHPQCPVVALESVCAAIIDNLHSNPIYAESGVPCVRSPDVGWGTLKLDTALKTDEAEYRRRTIRGEPQADDIVLVREGGGTGKAARVLHGQRFSLGQRVMMLRPDRQKVLPQFFLYQLLSPLIQDDHIVPLSKGSASPHLNIGALRNFPFKLPSLEDQVRIVDQLDNLRAEVDALRSLQAQTSEELEALLPSVLARAFTGEL